MSIERIAETTQTVYAELLDQLRGAPLVPRSGSFVSKVIRDRTYWYVQRVDGGRRRQIYLGPESNELLAQIHEAEKNREELAEDLERRRELVAMLLTGGMRGEVAAIGTVIEVLAESGLFRTGAVLVGTQAFTAIANLLGVRFELQSMRTADVDVAHPRIAVAVGEMVTDLLEELRASEPRFVAVPELDARMPSTSFKVRGRDLRVDLLTPGSRSGMKPVFLRHLNAAALPLPGLDYLIADPIQGAVLSGSGVLVNVPSPSRFALHKLWVAGERNRSDSAKGRKDLRQASQLLEVLLTDQPQELTRAWLALPDKMRARVEREVRQLESPIADELRTIVTDARVRR